jgi:hypothetical protein
MNEHKEIHIIVEITRTDRRELTFHQDHVTGREIKEKAGVPPESELFANQEDEFHVVPNEETITIRNGERFAVLPHGAIHYTVNGELQGTTERELTPVKIMEDAGIDPAQNYLIEIKHHEKESFKDHPDKTIHMHNGLKFITNFMGPKPVSNH